MSAAISEREVKDDLPEAAHLPAQAGRVVRDSLRTQVDGLKQLDSMVRANEPDAVHKMRISTRRLRSVLVTFRPTVGTSADLLASELKWLGGLLGLARDAETLGARLRADLDQLPAEQVIGPVRARVQGHYASAGARARRAVIAALDSDRYFALIDGLEQLAASPVQAGPGTELAQVALPAAIRRAYHRTSRRMRRAQDAAPGPAFDTALHETRKAAKRARYAAEAVAPALGDGADRFARQMQRVQSVLGEHQDRVLARQAARQLAISAHQSGENAYSYGILYQQNTSEAEVLRARAFRIWARASRPRYRRWLRRG